jgi:hypothetical protein
VVNITWPTNTAPGKHAQDGSGRLINVFPEDRQNQQGLVWRRAPGATLFTGTYPTTAAMTGTASVTFAGVNTQGAAGATNYGWGNFVSASQITGGTPFGNMARSTAAFNGTLQQVSSNAAFLTSSDAYVGLTFASSEKIGGVLVYGTNDGFTAASIFQIAVYGSTAATVPGASTEGTLIGTSSGAQISGLNPQGINSGDQTTYYNHVTVRLYGTSASAKRVGQVVVLRTT